MSLTSRTAAVCAALAGLAACSNSSETRHALDENGRLWVSAFRPTTDLWNEEDAWHILRPSGHPLARVRLPMNARIAAVRQNRVALIMRDSLDVEHLRVFRLLETAPGEL